MEDDQEYESRVEVARYVIGSHLEREFRRGLRYGIALGVAAVVIVAVLVALAGWQP